MKIYDNLLVSKAKSTVQTSTTKALGSSSANAFEVLDSTSAELFSVKENGNTTIGGTLTITGSGSSAFTGATSVDSLTVNNNLTVNGNTILGDAPLVDTTLINGVTTVKTGKTKALGSNSVDAFKVVDSTGAGLFQVKENGDTVIGGVLTVNGTGTSTFAGDVSIGGALTVATGTTAVASLAGTDLSLTGNLVVNGNTTLGDAGTDTISVVGATTFTGNVVSNGTFVSNGNMTLGSAVGDIITSSGTVTLPTTTTIGGTTAGAITTSVTNSHTHSNKATLDAYTQTEANLSSAVTLKHAQNTDTTLTGSGVMAIVTTGAGNIAEFKVSSTVKASVDATGKFTGTHDWANINNKPTSAIASIDSAVANSHTHTNKALLDTYTQTEANLASAVGLKHTQNTDIGTSNATFYVGGTGGVAVKNNAGVFEVRNGLDNAYANLRCNNLTVDGTTTTINSNTINIGDSDLELNTDITTNAGNSDGGITVKRLKVDNTTRADARMNFNNSTGRWEQTFGAVASVQTATVPVKVVATIGNGTNNSFAIVHNLNTQDIMVSICESATPWEIVYTTVKATDVNTATVYFNSIPTTNQYKVTIIG